MCGLYSFEDLEKLLQLLVCEFGKDFAQNLLLSNNNEGSTVVPSICKKKECDFDESFQFLLTLFDEQRYNKLKEEYNSLMALSVT